MGLDVAPLSALLALDLYIDLLHSTIQHERLQEGRNRSNLYLIGKASCLNELGSSHALIAHRIQQSLADGSLLILSSLLLLQNLLGALCVGLIHLLDKLSSLSHQLIIHLAIGNSSVELTISHKIPLSAPHCLIKIKEFTA
nr:MAG TPA: hypothetical protein [Herelleviridae sp.]